MEDDLYFGKPPRKQGLQYSLNLGQNNGPFLAKDIMHSNINSIKLLVGHEEIKKDPKKVEQTAASFIPQTLKLDEPPEMYDDKRQVFINYDEKYKTKFTNSENLTSNDTVEILKKESNDLKDSFVDYRESLEDMTTMINDRHNKNTVLLQTIMKDFYTDLKDQLYEKKNENYQLMRELQQLEREKFQLHQQMLFCQRRIQDIENVTGVKQPIFEEDTEDYDRNY